MAVNIKQTLTDVKNAFVSSNVYRNVIIKTKHELISIIDGLRLSNGNEYLISKLDNIVNNVLNIDSNIDRINTNINGSNKTSRNTSNNGSPIKSQRHSDFKRLSRTIKVDELNDLLDEIDDDIKSDTDNDSPIYNNIKSIEPNKLCLCTKWSDKKDSNGKYNYPTKKPFKISWKMIKCVMKNFEADQDVMHRTDEVMMTYNTAKQKRKTKYFDSESYLFHTIFNAKMITLNDGRLKRDETSKLSSNTYIWDTNIFPYNFSECITHLLLWGTFPLTNDEIIQKINETGITKYYESIHWVNPPHRQTVPNIWHCHILFHPKITVNPSIDPLKILIKQIHKRHEQIKIKL